MNTCIFLSTCTLQPINLSSISSFQHHCILFFILFSFFKHLKREKFNTNNYIRYTVIIYWEIAHVMSNHSWSVSHATSMQPLCISHTPQRTIATVTRHQCNLNATVTRHSAPSQHIAHHRNTSRTIATPSPMSSFQHSPHTSFIFFSFFKHITREKLNINNQHTIHLFIEKWLMYWGTTHVFSQGGGRGG